MLAELPATGEDGRLMISLDPDSSATAFPERVREIFSETGMLAKAPGRLF
jgi:hypothetical protein